VLARTEGLLPQRNFCAAILSETRVRIFLCRFDTPGAAGNRASRLNWQKWRGGPLVQVTQTGEGSRMIAGCFRRIGLALLLTGVGAALAGPVVPRAQPAQACSEAARWLAFDGKRLQGVPAGSVLADAAASEVVLIGEQHDVEDHHRWQLQVLAALHAQRPDLVIGFEMFPRRVQPVLDRWVSGQLSIQDFFAQAEWEKVWNFPPQLYLPLFEFARINRIPMVALNVDQKLIRAISDKGGQAVPVAERDGVGRAASPPAAYREFLRETHLAHLAGRKQAPGTQGSFENFLDAQLTWDRAMAEALARRVASADSPQRPLVVGIMGSGHIRFGHGVAHQLRDLGVARVASLLPASTKEECRSLQPGLASAIFLLPEKPQPAPEPPRLGVTLEEGEKGVRIAQVSAGSLAEKSGLLAGDRIVEMAGRPVTGSAEVIAAVRRQPPGTWLPLKVARKDAPLEILVRFPARP